MRPKLIRLVNLPGELRFESEPVLFVKAGENEHVSGRASDSGPQQVHSINIYRVFGTYVFLSTELKVCFSYKSAVRYFAKWLERIYDDQIPAQETAS